MDFGVPVPSEPRTTNSLVPVIAAVWEFGYLWLSRSGRAATLLVVDVTAERKTVASY